MPGDQPGQGNAFEFILIFFHILFYSNFEKGWCWGDDSEPFGGKLLFDTTN